MHILITGGTGFLGSHLAKGLSDQAGITVLARSNSSLARLDNCANSITVLRIDSSSGMDNAISTVRPDCIIHTACNYGRSGERTTEIAQTNLLYSLGVLDAAIQAGVRSFINTDTSLDKYLNSYTLSKRQFSEWGHWLAGRRQIQFINVLLEHIYGPGDDSSKFTSRIIRSCVDNAATLDLTGGEQRRDFLFIDDAVAAYRMLVNHLAQLDAHEDIAVGSGHAISIREFTETVHLLAASHTVLRFGALPYRENEPMHSVADTARLRSFGWRPETDLATGILKTIKAEQSR
jgi:nucleoside-diphosphate-sugar epimerase